MLLSLFLIFFLVSGIVGYIGWFFTDDRGIIGLVSVWCCGFVMVVCSVVLYMHWFSGLELDW